MSSQDDVSPMVGRACPRRLEEHFNTPMSSRAASPRSPPAAETPARTRVVTSAARPGSHRPAPWSRRLRAMRPCSTTAWSWPAAAPPPRRSLEGDLVQVEHLTAATARSRAGPTSGAGLAERRRGAARTTATATRSALGCAQRDRWRRSGAEPWRWKKEQVHLARRVLSASDPARGAAHLVTRGACLPRRLLARRSPPRPARPFTQLG